MNLKQKQDQIYELKQDIISWNWWIAIYFILDVWGILPVAVIPSMAIKGFVLLITAGLQIWLQIALRQEIKLYNKQKNTLRRPK